MKFLSRFVLALLLVSPLAAPTVEASELTPHRAQYKVKILIVSGQLNTELKATDSGYVATHEIKAAGMSRMLTRGTMKVTSEFKTEEDGVKPVTYNAVDTILDDPETHIFFDWDKHQASGTVGEEEVLLQLDGISHDSVSIQYQLMHDLLNGGPSDSYVLFDVDRLQVANVRNIGTKLVDTKAGKFEVVGIQHQKEGSSRRTTLWCSAELGYLPVIIEQHRDGKIRLRATLTNYTPI